MAETAQQNAQAAQSGSWSAFLKVCRCTPTPQGGWHTPVGSKGPDTDLGGSPGP